MFSGHWHYAGAELPKSQEELDEYNERVEEEIVDLHPHEDLDLNPLPHPDLFLSPTKEWREKRMKRMRKNTPGPPIPELVNDEELCRLSTLCENLSECIEILKSKERYSIGEGDESSQDRIDKTRVYLYEISHLLGEYECLLQQ